MAFVALLPTPFLVPDILFALIVAAGFVAEWVFDRPARSPAGAPDDAPAPAEAARVPDREAIRAVVARSLGRDRLAD